MYVLNAEALPRYPEANESACDTLNLCFLAELWETPITSPAIAGCKLPFASDLSVHDGVAARCMDLQKTGSLEMFPL
jgi:hypothetical protein